MHERLPLPLPSPRMMLLQADGSQRWVSFSTATGFGGSAVTFYEFAEDGSLVHETVHKLEVRRGAGVMCPGPMKNPHLGEGLGA